MTEDQEQKVADRLQGQQSFSMFAQIEDDGHLSFYDQQNDEGTRYPVRFGVEVDHLEINTMWIDRQGYR